jgi:hypothetical protein
MSWPIWWTADEIFITSVSLGVVLITTFDFRQYSICATNLAVRLSDALNLLASKSKT